MNFISLFWALFVGIYFLFFLFFTFFFPSFYAKIKKSTDRYPIMIINVLIVFLLIYAIYNNLNINILFFYFFMWLYLAFLAKVNTEGSIRANIPWSLIFLSILLPFYIDIFFVVSMFFLIYLIYKPILKDILKKLMMNYEKNIRNNNGLSFLFDYFIKNILFLIIVGIILHFHFFVISRSILESLAG